MRSGKHVGNGLATTVVLLGIAVMFGVKSAPAFEVPRVSFEPRQYVCAQAPGPVAVDGRLDETAWQGVPWTEPFQDIEGPSQRPPRLLTRVKMTWDQDAFYIGARLDEPHVWGTLEQRDAVIYHDNDFEVFIDPDGDTHLYYELEINALGTVWDLLLARPYRDGGPAIDAWDIAGLQAAVHVDGTLNDPSDTDRGWTVELALPWDVLAEAAGRAAPPRPGDIWRVNFSRVQWSTQVRDGGYVKITDDAGQPLPESNWVWSAQGLIAMHYPEMWGEVLFAGPGRTTLRGAPEHARAVTAAMLMPLHYLQKQYQEDHGRFATSLADLDLGPEELPAWPAAGVTSVEMPRGWSLDMAGDGDVYSARLTTQLGVVGLDHTGRLRWLP